MLAKIAAGASAGLDLSGGASFVGSSAPGLVRDSPAPGAQL
ncbi:MAG: hypothetical protein ACP5VR_08330 [Acidimicrobiales bacterium]